MTHLISVTCCVPLCGADCLLLTQVVMDFDAARMPLTNKAVREAILDRDFWSDLDKLVTVLEPLAQVGILFP